MDLAAQAGINPRTLDSMAHGSRNFSTDVISKIADFFGVTTDWLLGRSPDDAKELEEQRQRLTTLDKEQEERWARMQVTVDNAERYKLSVEYSHQEPERITLRRKIAQAEILQLLSKAKIVADTFTVVGEGGPLPEGTVLFLAKAKKDLDTGGVFAVQDGPRVSLSDHPNSGELLGAVTHVLMPVNTGAATRLLQQLQQ